MIGEATYWNGMPAAAQRGTGIVVDRGDFPLYWARTEGIVGQRIPIVRVTYRNQVFDLDDRDDIGWTKVTTLHGSPRASHRNVVIDPDSWQSRALGDEPPTASTPIICMICNRPIDRTSVFHTCVTP